QQAILGNKDRNPTTHLDAILPRRVTVTNHDRHPKPSELTIETIHVPAPIHLSNALPNLTTQPATGRGRRAASTLTRHRRDPLRSTAIRREGAAEGKSDKEIRTGSRSYVVRELYGALSV